MPTCIEKLSKSKKCHCNPPRHTSHPAYKSISKYPAKPKNNNNERCCNKCCTCKCRPERYKDDSQTVEYCCNNCCNCKSRPEPYSNEYVENAGCSFSKNKNKLNHKAVDANLIQKCTIGSNEKPLNVNLKLQLVDDEKNRNGGCLCAKYFEMLDACFGAFPDDQKNVPKGSGHNKPKMQPTPPPLPPGCSLPGPSNHYPMCCFFPPPADPAALRCMFAPQTAKPMRCVCCEYTNQQQNQSREVGCNAPGKDVACNVSGQLPSKQVNCDPGGQSPLKAVNKETLQEINNTLIGITDTLLELQNTVKLQKDTIKVPCNDSDTPKGCRAYTVGRVSIRPNVSGWPFIPKRMPPPPPPPMPMPYIPLERDEFGLYKTIPKYCAQKSSPTMFIKEPNPTFTINPRMAPPHSTERKFNEVIANDPGENVTVFPAPHASCKIPPNDMYPLRIGLQEEPKLNGQLLPKQREIYSQAINKSSNSLSIITQPYLKNTLNDKQPLPFNDGYSRSFERNELMEEIKQHIEEIMRTRYKDFNS